MKSARMFTPSMYRVNLLLKMNKLYSNQFRFAILNYHQTYCTTCSRTILYTASIFYVFLPAPLNDN